MTIPTTLTVRGLCIFILPVTIDYIIDIAEHKEVYARTVRAI